MNLSPKELAVVRAALRGFLSKKGAQAYLFGSRVFGSPRPDSDLDVLLKTTAEIPFHEIGRLKETFEGSPLPFKVDIIDYHRIGATFRRKILAHAIPILGADPR